MLNELVFNLINYIKNLLLSQDFIFKYRESDKDFTRKGALCFDRLVSLLMNMNNSPYQTELDNFFDHILDDFEEAKVHVHKGSLSKARKKLKHEVFIALNDEMLSHYYKYFPVKTWKGFTLLAVDGTTITVPDVDCIKNEFGVWKPKKGGECPKARASQMFDVLNDISVDTIIKPKDHGERELAAFHFLKLTSKDLILLDRGYPSFWLFKLILSMDSSFCARVSATQWNSVKEFADTGHSEGIITIEPSAPSRKKCKEFGLDDEPIKLRIVRVELDSGEPEFLLTNLYNSDTYKYEIFSDLYHMRWPVETDYNKLKNRLLVENFSGKSVKSVYQDFYAKVLSKNLTCIIINSVDNEIEEKSKRCKYPQKVNFSQAITKMKNRICLFFYRSSDEVKKIIKSLQKCFYKLSEGVREGRKFPRNFNNKKSKFSYEYKNSA